MGTMNAFAASMFNRSADNVAGLTKAKEKKPRVWKLKITEEQLLEMRAKHEFEGWPPRKCAEHFKLDKLTCYRYLNYTVAAFVIPKRPHSSSEKPSSGLTK